MTYTVVNKDELPHSGSAYRFEGHRHGGAHVSFFISDTAPGKGPGLHTHPYDEVFILQEGELTFTERCVLPTAWIFEVKSVDVVYLG
jgi:quercetin dioxygenase-like cupin family protein